MRADEPRGLGEESLIPALPLTLDSLVATYSGALQEIDFLIEQIDGALAHLEARMKSSPLVSARFNQWEPYTASLLDHLVWRVTDVCVSPRMPFADSPARVGVLNLKYTPSGVAHPVDAEQLEPMREALVGARKALEALLADIDRVRLRSMFLCHSTADKEFARRLAVDLRERGSDVWIDEAEIRVGDSLLGKIAQGIKGSDVLGVVLTPTAVGSPWVGTELEMAMSQEIEGREVVVLPLLLVDCEIPLFLKMKRYADFRDHGQYERALGTLLDSLRRGAP